MRTAAATVKFNNARNIASKQVVGANERRGSARRPPAPAGLHLAASTHIVRRAISGGKHKPGGVRR
jgi:hypothetical protein